MANKLENQILSTALQELRLYANRPDTMLKNVIWVVGDKNFGDIRYNFGTAERAQRILREFPYEEPTPGTYGTPTDTSIAGTHPVVNIILTAQIFKNKNDPAAASPMVLYFEPEYNYGEDLQKVEYDDIKGAYDVLGAINTYYMDRANGKPEDIADILMGHIFFEGLRPYEDGFEPSLGS